MGTYLETLGIAGWSALEAPILCALKTGTPVNLIGNKGTSKTEFAHRMSLALLGKNSRFQKYDTPDATLDQIIGFMDLKKMEEGEVGFIKTGTSIWNKTSVLWDEMNRASPMFQGKLLEVVRTGTIHGKETDVLLQFGACNPPRATKTSVGHDVYFLGEAFASRFFHQHVPDISVALYDAALRLDPIRQAFDKNDQKRIAEVCAPLAKLWIDFKAAKPTEEDQASASKIVRGVLGETTKLGYFDMRSALRTTDMIAELLVLHRIDALDGTLIEALQSIVIGNIAELNGIIRNDRSGDLELIKATVLGAAQSIIKGTKSDASLNLTSLAFRMLRQGTFDEISINSLLTTIKTTTPSLVVYTSALGSLVKKVDRIDKFRSPTYREGHKRVLASILAQAQIAGYKSFNIELFPGATNIVIDTNSKTANECANDMHKHWYVQCGLGDV